MENNTTNISEEERKLIENKTSGATNIVRFICPETNQKPSPFKIYEDMYCSECEDYRGCLGLIDSIAMNTQESKKSGYEALDNALKSMGSIVFASRFKLILDCMEMRNYLGNTTQKN